MPCEVSLHRVPLKCIYISVASYMRFPPGVGVIKEVRKQSVLLI